MAGQYDIVPMEIGATFTLTFAWTINGNPVDLTGYTAEMHVRRKHTTATTLLDFSSAAGDITLNGALGTGVVKALIPNSLNNTVKRGVYDLELTASNGDVTRLLEGIVVFSPEVTHD